MCSLFIGKAAAYSMSVPVVGVGKVRMPVEQERVSMGMRVRLAGRLRADVVVPMVLVMDVTMLVEHGFVLVRVVMVLGQVQPRRRGGPCGLWGEYG